MTEINKTSNADLEMAKFKRDQAEKQLNNQVTNPDWTAYGRQQRREEYHKAEINLILTRAKAENRAPNSEELKQVDMHMQEVVSHDRKVVAHQNNFS